MRQAIVPSRSPDPSGAASTLSSTPVATLRAPLVACLLMQPLLFCPEVRCESGRIVGAFRGVEEIYLETVVGGALDAVEDTGPALRLFGGDLVRAEAFRESLPVLLKEPLASQGVSLSDDISNELEIAVFGRPAARESEDVEIFFVKMSLFLARRSDCEPYVRTHIGISATEDLERSLSRAILALLDGYPKCRDDGEAPLE